jgi:hypothetical protein
MLQAFLIFLNSATGMLQFEVGSDPATYAIYQGHFEPNVDLTQYVGWQVVSIEDQDPLAYLINWSNVVFPFCKDPSINFNTRGFGLGFKEWIPGILPTKGQLHKNQPRQTQK